MRIAQALSFACVPEVLQASLKLEEVDLEMAIVDSEPISRPDGTLHDEDAAVGSTERAAMCMVRHVPWEAPRGASPTGVQSVFGLLSNIPGISAYERRRSRASALLCTLGFPQEEDISNILPASIAENQKYKLVNKEGYCEDKHRPTKIYIHPRSLYMLGAHPAQYPVPPVYDRSLTRYHHVKAWTHIATQVLSLSDDDVVDRFLRVSESVLGGCLRERPTQSSGEAICYPIGTGLEGRHPREASVLQEEFIDECSKVEKRCSYQHYLDPESAPDVNTYLQRSEYCAYWAKSCVKKTGPACLMYGDNVTYREYRNFVQMVKDVSRLGNDMDLLIEHLKRSESPVTAKLDKVDSIEEKNEIETSVVNKLSMRIRNHMLADIGDGCLFILLTLLYGRPDEFHNDYSQGMNMVCGFLHGYLGMTITESTVTMEYIYRHITRLDRVPEHRSGTYHRVLYAYLRLAMPKDIRDTLDQLDSAYVELTGGSQFEKFGAEALLNFHITLGIRYIDNDSRRDHIRNEHTLPLWNFLFQTGRKGFLALFLGGIEMNSELIKSFAIEFDAEAAVVPIGKLIQSPISRIFNEAAHPNLPDPAKNPDGFDAYLQTVVSLHLSHATDVLTSPRFNTLMVSLDDIVEDIVSGTHFDVTITDERGFLERIGIN